LLALYVEDVDGFHALIQSSYKIQAQAEKLAGPIHHDWFDHLTQERLDRGGPKCRPYADLEDEDKKSNIAAALRIPEILSLAGYVLEDGLASDDDENQVKQALEEKLELLAEAEHMGWDEQTRLEGWVYGPLWDDKKKTHNLLIPYSELPEIEKEKDRGTIRNYPKYAKAVGLKIMPRKKDAQAA
jgi:hypothetical protein